MDKRKIKATTEHSLEAEIVSLKHSAACVIFRTNPTSSEIEYLLVKELRSGRIVYNQPVGGVEEGEYPKEAAAREALEETGHEVTVSDYLGIMSQEFPSATYVRSLYAAQVVLDQERVDIVDEDVLDAEWFNLEEILDMRDQGLLRNDMVVPSILRYLGIQKES